MLQVQKFARLLKSSSAKHAALLCHQNADPDATSSALVLQRILLAVNPNITCEIAAPQGASSASHVILNKLSGTVTEQPSLKKADFFVLVDTSTIQQLGDWSSTIEQTRKPIVLIDHHAAHPSMKKLDPLTLVDENSRSTCEIVYDLGRKLGFRFSREEAWALIYGIIHETKHFRIATSHTLQAVLNLARTGIELQEIFTILTKPMPVSERVARLKAAQRIHLTKIHNWLIATSRINSFEASGARALINLGADAAIVAGGKKNQVRLSLRSTTEFTEKTGIHLGRDIAFRLGELVSGVGGGHSSAAGVNGKGHPHNALIECLHLIEGQLLKHQEPKILI